MDPASILFDNNTLEDQLDPTDAKFVQVIHTDGNALGKNANIGDADFYPNGGFVQPGCSGPGGCSHSRVVDFYLESISSKEFIATSCASYEDFTEGKCSSNEHVTMGEWSPPSTSGVFYLNTNAESPFAQGQTEL
ncbi:Uncharacterized protein GBIM_05236 [Gryllus bimaculatus]|nr:Uncharacterized protein GBIM_05236 [Gryllus bimaculatus]